MEDLAWKTFSRKIRHQKLTHVVEPGASTHTVHTPSILNYLFYIFELNCHPWPRKTWSERYLYVKPIHMINPSFELILFTDCVGEVVFWYDTSTKGISKFIDSPKTNRAQGPDKFSWKLHVQAHLCRFALHIRQNFSGNRNCVSEKAKFEKTWRNRETRLKIAKI